MLLLGTAAGASAMTVDTTADSAATAGQCSLRDAITAVENGDGNTACGSLASSGPTTIILPTGSYALDAGELHITGSADVAIVGADSSQPGATTIDAGHYSRVFEVDPQAQLSLSAVEVANGRSPNGVTPTKPGVFGESAPDGGGILNNGRLTLDHVTVTGNSTGFGGTGAQGVQPAGCGK
jgi:CSLREA domain-containing protein